MNHNDCDIKMRILLSAKKLFAKQGYEGTSVRQICEDAGANVALISYHFGGKEKVFTALFEKFFPGKLMSDYSEQLSEPLPGLRLLISEVIHFTFKDRELSSIIQQEVMLDSPRRDIVMEFLYPVWSKVKELLIEGKEEGLFDFDSLSNTLLMVIGAALAHKRVYDFERLIADEEMNPEQIPEQTVKFILRGLGVNEV
ncbi:TetR family transcriptional regulator [Paenibacillus sp. YPG26]|uniref:TetR family transcriptional regulator n=1 Tax=Paenibacillus sp. YPG26 TaxID=2878915 RepID=UPI00203F0323|nr:TetR family transcriptional regulator [Paenibacillus sp. YPG26]USB33700.1 TetR family transcriptional regulator [Paenibacillus sp. YPG26]